MQRKNPQLEEDAKKGEFPAGLIVQKMSIILGDIRSKAGLAALLKELDKKDEGMAPECLSGAKACVSGHQSVLQAIGLHGDMSAAKTLIGVLNDGKRNAKLRSAAAEGLNLLGATEALPAMLAAAKVQYLKPAKNKDELPEIDTEKAALAVGAATQFGRLCDTDQTAALEPLFKAAPPDTDASIAFQNALARVDAVKTCKKDIKCWGELLDSQAKEMDKLEESKKGKDDNQKALIDYEKAKASARAEKAAFMLARLGRDGLPYLVKNIGYKDTAPRFGIMFALTRVATKADQDVFKALDAQIEMDKTKDKSMQALADEMRVTAAIVSHR